VRYSGESVNDYEIDAGPNKPFKQIHKITAHMPLAFRSFSAVLSAI